MVVESIDKLFYTLDLVTRAEDGRQWLEMCHLLDRLRDEAFEAREAAWDTYNRGHYGG